MRKRIMLLPILLTAFSCATAISGRRESLAVDSTPAGADARLFCAGKQVSSGVTPITFTIRRKAGDCDLTVSKSGFTEQTSHIEQGVNPWYWTNFATAPVALAGAYVTSGATVALGAGMILVGAGGWFIDNGTGAIHTHRPKSVKVTLQPKRER